MAEKLAQQPTGDNEATSVSVEVKARRPLTFVGCQRRRKFFDGGRMWGQRHKPEMHLA